MELYNIYCGFWEGMKKISVGVCLNEYTWLKIWEKEKWTVQKDQMKKKKNKEWSWTRRKRKMKREKGNISAIWDLLCKVSEIDVIWKEKLCSTSL